MAIVEKILLGSSLVLGRLGPDDEWEHIYAEAKRDAYLCIHETFGEPLEVICEWCDKNTPNEYKIHDEITDVLDKTCIGARYGVSIELLTAEATMAFKLRWI